MMLVLLVACNTDPNKGSKAGEGAAVKAYTWSPEDDNTFLESCVDSARAQQVSEAQAFARCKCVMEKLKEKFPSLDSASSVLMDVDKAKEFTDKCMDVEK